MAFPGSSAAAALRDRFERRSRRLQVSRTVRESLVSLAGLVGRPVFNPAGATVGCLVDVVVRWDGAQPYPPLAGLVVRVGDRRVFVSADAVARLGQSVVELSTARLDLRDFRPRPGEAGLAGDVLDHQLVDIDGARVVRAADLYLATIAGQVRLVGLDVGFNTLLRRLGPARWRTRPTTDAVIDWASVHSFGAATGPRGVQLARHRGELSRLRPAELADLLEDLGRTQRQELLDVVEPDAAADAIEEMRGDKVHQLLMDTTPVEAAGYLARMEPDEAADALRDIDEQTRAAILVAMPPDATDRVAALLEHGGDTAGGIMTSVVVTARIDERVRDVRDRLRAEAEHLVDLDALVVIDADGRLVDDVSTIELLLAEPTTVLAELIGSPWPVTVTPTTPVREVAQRLIDARRLSVVVLDDQQRPIGRILADDIIDALIPGRGRLRLARLH